jgi:hypothetical protein
MTEFGSQLPTGAADAHRRVVSCNLSFHVDEPAEIALQMAPSLSAGRLTGERLGLTIDHSYLPQSGECVGPHGTRIQLLRAPVGQLDIDYRAELVGSPATLSETDFDDAPGADFSRLLYLRPSRYCPSDHLTGFAVAEFGMDSTVAERVTAVTQWVRQRVGYVAGSSSVHDSAEDTLLTGTGTCRDFAHLCVALCRSLGIPARFASVYAPGLSPMDFHAVFEALEGKTWQVHDATGLAPRHSLVRIATGRDASDTAFSSVLSGIASLDAVTVTATTGGNLPVDDGVQAVVMA